MNSLGHIANHTDGLSHLPISIVHVLPLGILKTVIAVRCSKGYRNTSRKITAREEGIFRSSDTRGIISTAFIRKRSPFRTDVNKSEN